MEQLFFAVPEELFRDRLLPFFHLVDLVHLDEATANKALREKLHDELKNACFQDCGELEIDADACRWMHHRHITVKNMVFSSDVNGHELIGLEPLFRETVTLKFKDCLEINYSNLHTMADYCTKLTTLDLSGCSHVQGNALLYIIRWSEALQHLDVSGTLVGDETLAQICVLHLCTELVSFGCSGCEHVYDDGIIALAENCTKLHTVDISNTLISDLAVRAVAEYCPLLVDLNLDSCEELTDTSIHSIAQHCTQLQTLHISKGENFTDEPMLQLAQRCTDLRVLCIAGCINITDVSVVAIATSCRNLQSIDLQHTELSDDTLNALADCCPQLTSLNISNCHHFSQDAIIAVVMSCTALQSLDLFFTNNVTTQVLDALSQYCKNLEYLNLCHGEMAVCDISITNLVSKNPKLVALNLAHCHTISDEAVTAIATHCTGLQFLDLTCCRRITDASLQVLMQHCPKLSSLEVMQCPKISVQAIDHMIDNTFVCVSY